MEPAAAGADPGVNRRLVSESVVGLPLDGAGAGRLVRPVGPRLSHDGARLPLDSLVALLPLVGLAGVLYYAIALPSADGDTVKAMFCLTAVPAWAISFGFAADVLLGRSRRVAIPVLAVLALCGLVALSFATYASVS